MRLCDGCGIKVPRFQPRTNQNGQMLCNGCAEGKPGAPGRPIGLHGSVNPDPADRIFAQLRESMEPVTAAPLHTKTKTFPAGTPRSTVDAWIEKNVPKKARDLVSVITGSDGRTIVSAEWGNTRFDPSDYVRSDFWDARVPDEMWTVKEYVDAKALKPGDRITLDWDSKLDKALVVVSNDPRLVVRLLNGSTQILPRSESTWEKQPNGSYDRPKYYNRWVPKGGGSWQDAKAAALQMVAAQHLAHDSGDGATIYHCPFCGGGQVVAGSDGSVECGYCHTLFTVQVQPEHAAMPQTINGVPQDMPGMPGEVGGVPEGGAGPVPGASPATDTGTDAFVPPDAFAPPPAAAGAAGAPPAPPVKAAFYLNANGVALDEEAFVRHLAIAYADDPAGVIEQVRQERTNA